MQFWSGHNFVKEILVTAAKNEIQIEYIIEIESFTAVGSFCVQTHKLSALCGDISESWPH